MKRNRLFRSSCIYLHCSYNLALCVIVYTSIKLYLLVRLTCTGVPHTTSEDVQLMGYDIPKDTMVVSNLYSVHFDPILWPDAQRFNPKHFLDSDGKLKRFEKVTPFSMGQYHLIVGHVFLLNILICIKGNYSSK